MSKFVFYSLMPKFAFYVPMPKFAFYTLAEISHVQKELHGIENHCYHFSQFNSNLNFYSGPFGSQVKF